jgi:allantoinase
MQKVADEAADIARTAAAIREATGKNPRGWLGPGLTETWDTPDLLAEAGYDYVCDWVLDDQPVVLKTRGEADRQPALHAGMQRRGDDADPAPQGREYQRPRDRPVRAALPRRGRESARVMALVVHPYIMGAPHRLKYFRNALAHIAAHDGVVCWTGEQILDWYLAQ